MKDLINNTILLAFIQLARCFANAQHDTFKGLFQWSRTVPAPILSAAKGGKRDPGHFQLTWMRSILESMLPLTMDFHSLLI